MKPARRRFARSLLAAFALAATGCATRDMPGYQITYQGYDIPPALLNRIEAKFAENGLGAARIVRDSVGRVRLAGSYHDEDEVERAFLIVQSIVGLKSTSPFYPEDVSVKRWQLEAARAMSAFSRPRLDANGAPRKRALVVGINTFLDSGRLKAIQGEDDARLVHDRLQRGGYEVTALFGPRATKAAIEAAIERLGRELGPDDTLFIYVSSHGNPPVPTPRGGEDRRMSIAAYDSGDTDGRTRRDKTDYLLHLQKTSVRDTLVQELAQRPARVTRVFIDTCYSGEMLRGVADESGDYISRTNGGQPERAGVSLASWSGPQYASKGIKLVDSDTAERAAPTAPTLPPVVSKKSGYTVITATSEGQESLGPPTTVGVFPSPLDPQRSLRGSFFTQAFFDYLARHEGQVSAAFDDARRFTEQKALAVSGGRAKQVPRQFSTMAASDNNLYR